ncbi:hypothetical protein MYX78_03795 [Acidobacteria bacterium AH-259-G07]|nr:hypothetical protein [Acidobacteria bacterium AH-259-G07]
MNKKCSGRIKTLRGANAPDSNADWEVRMTMRRLFTKPVTTIRYDDPFKRGFEYVPFAASHDA